MNFTTHNANTYIQVPLEFFQELIRRLEKIEKMLCEKQAERHTGFLSRKNAAAFLDVNPKTLDSYVERRIIKVYKVKQGAPKFSKKELIEAFEPQRIV